MAQRSQRFGRIEDGIDHIREAMRINPYHPEWYWITLGSVLYVARRYGDAIEAYKRKANPQTWVLSRLAACYAQLGRREEAAQATAEILRLKPDFTDFGAKHCQLGTWQIWNTSGKECARRGCPIDALGRNPILRDTSANGSKLEVAQASRYVCCAHNSGRAPEEQQEFPRLRPI